ncbi:MAG: hypothetical protein K2K59_02275 [Muribaculaceae bacterium]|nr:hypothetical protein [Muribaculaceae bacterium]
MIQYKVITFLMFLAAMLCGCQKSQVSQQLDRAETIMEERPDSALAILREIDGSALSGEPQARHALLLSQALDKNYIDQTNDSLISIATAYYNKHNDQQRKLMAGYYNVVILMNRLDYDEALLLAFDVEKLADKLHDIEYLARIRQLIARAYLFSFNQEGARDYFEKSLDLMRKLQKREWTGMVFINLSNLALYQQDYALAIEYADSAKCYIPEDPDIPEYELLALVGLHDYIKADSLYTHHIPNPSIQAKAYKLLVDFQLGKKSHVKDSLSLLLSNASHFDSIDIAYVCSHINRLTGNLEQALNDSEALQQESNNVIKGLSAHSLYRIQIEHEKLKQAEVENQLRVQRLSLVFVSIIILLIVAFGIIYFRMVSNRHREQIAQTRDKIISISSEFAEMQANLTQEIDRQRLEISTLNNQIQTEQEATENIRTTLTQSIENQSQVVSKLNKQILDGRAAAHELFISRFAWIEDLGNVFIDADLTTQSSNRALKGLKKKLDSVKTKKFISELKEIINKYYNNLIERLVTECPSISESELTIFALLYVNLSPRIISFILNIQPQSVYNAKSSIKRKLEHSNRSLLSEISNIYS